jgi:hypothetical protein
MLPKTVLLHMRSKIESVFDYLKEHLHLVSSFPRSMAGFILQYVRILLAYQIMAELSALCRLPETCSRVSGRYELVSRIRHSCREA